MSALPNQPEKDQSDAKAGVPSPDLPALASPEVGKDQSDARAGVPSPDQPALESPEGEEEEEGECGFCLFMKGGGCKDTFVDWENCVKEAEDKNEDLVEKCSQVTARLKQCMDAHSNYYEPILRAEKHAEEQAVIELEKEKQAEEQAVVEVEKEKQDSAANNNQQKAPSESNQK